MVERWSDVISSELSEVDRVILDSLSSKNVELEGMCRYVTSSGGKRIRPAVCILSYLACGGQDVQVAVRAGAGFEILHTASLVHDDINDNGQIRRGRKTLHREYTLTKALIAGDYMLVNGYRCLSHLPDEATELIIKAAGMMAESEFVQKDFEHDFNVTVEDYYEIINGKTAMLIVASSIAGAYLADASNEIIEAIGKYAENIGLAFQIIDDILDVIGTKDTGKMVGIDLLEGKPTLPIIFALHDTVHGDPLRDIFSKEATVDDVDVALDLIRRTDAIDSCYREADIVAEKAIFALDPIPDSVYKLALINLARYIVRRDR